MYPKKGTIKEGSDADIIIFNQKEKWTITKDNLETKGKSCAHLYYGDNIEGKINMTIVNGKIVYDNGKFFEPKNLDNYINIQKNQNY